MLEVARTGTAEAQALLLATLANFLKFHLKLVLENFTTIENMERLFAQLEPGNAAPT